MLLVPLVRFWCALDVEASNGNLLVDVFLCVCEMIIHCFYPAVLQSLLEELWSRGSSDFGLHFVFTFPSGSLALALWG